MEVFFLEVVAEVLGESKENEKNTKGVCEVKLVGEKFEKEFDETSKVTDWETECVGFKGRVVMEGKEVGLILVRIDEPVLANTSTAVVSNFLFSFLSLEIASLLILQFSTRLSFFLAIS